MKSENGLTEQRQNWAAYSVMIATLLIFAAPAFLLEPALDDWTTASPLLQISPRDLLPGLFWRPLEVLQRAGAGLAPAHFVSIAHAMAVAGHSIAVLLIFHLVLRITSSRKSGALAACVFAVAPGGTAAVWSLDSSVQTWSTATGLASTLAYLSFRGPKKFVWLGLALLATLWKESGVAWFVLPPLLMPICRGKRDYRRAARDIAIGLVGVAVYLAFRMGLSQGVLGAGGGRYQLSLEPMNLLENASLLVGAGLSTADPLSIWGPSPSFVRLSLTAALGLPLLVVAIFAAWRSSGAAGVALAGLSVLAAAGPSLPLSHVSEMYAHPVIAVGVVVLAFLGEPWKWRPSLMILVFVAYFSAAALTASHKWRLMRETGELARTLGEQIARAEPRAPSTVCVVGGDRAQGYSVYWASEGAAAAWGRAALRPWGWPEVSWMKAPNCVQPKADLNLFFTPDGKLERIETTVDRSRIAL